MKILAIQNRMGIGDMVIFLPFIEAIAKKYNYPVSILVKENSKAAEILHDNKNIKEIIILSRDNKNKNEKHDGLLGSINLINDLKKYNFDEVFIFNSSLRFYLISKLAKINKIHQYPLFQKKNQHIVKAAQDFLKKKLNLSVESNPTIFLDQTKVTDAKKEYNISDTQTNILLGIGGSGDTKRIPAKTFIKFMEYCSNEENCRFFLATGNKKEELEILKEIMESSHNSKCLPLNNIKLNETLPIIKKCKISICNDSSFSHLSSALGIKTITLMADTPLIYGNYSSKMFPIIPEGEKTVTHNTLGKDKIDPQKIFERFLEITA